MHSYRLLLHGIIRIEESIYKKSVYLFGIRIWKTIYLNHKIKHYLFGRLKILVQDDYPFAISVVMHAYNSEKYIADAIDSVLCQTFADFEFIIINDGSIDGTPKIIREYNDPRIVFIDNKDNQGLARALNLGFDLSRGEYIARMDDKDVSYPTRFAKQIAFMKKHRNIGVLGSWYHFSESADQIKKMPINVKQNDAIISLPIYHSTAMLRKSIFNKYFLRYDDRHKHYEDDELLYRAINFMKIANLQEVLLRRRSYD